MLNYTIRRVAMAGLILWFVSLVVFTLMRLMPGDPTLLQQGISATPERIAAERAAQGLDDPIPVQYVRWFGGILTLDLGRSALNQASVTSEFKRRFPISFELMAFTLTWTVLFGIPFGVISAVKRNRAPDYVVRLTAILALAIPGFWLATLLLILPQQWWGYAPPLDRARSVFEEPLTNLRQFGPPSLILSFAPMASVMRLTRSALLEVLRTDYIRTARAKGLSDRAVIMNHALKNSIIPVVTVIGLQVAGLLGGSVIIESIFNLNGLGAYIFQAILQKDFAVAQSLVLYTGATVVFLNLAVDLAYGYLDPRIRYA
ncbi:MAG: ABC transporter permease [Dehalococcoidia bacterium]|nr:MAG: ABC transporter permease [Dehalococcoidia bacterium]